MLVDRLTAHSSDDDQRVYRTPDDIAEMKENDCVMLMEKQLLSEKVLSEAELASIKKELEAKINQATEEAEEMPNPASDQLMTHIYEEE